MIQLYNRKTGDLESEKIAGEKWIAWLYETAAGRQTLELLIKRHGYSFLTGLYCDTRLSRRLIKPFIENYQINMDESAKEAEEFHSFNDFFTRRLKPEARPFDQTENRIVSPGDGRIQVFENLSKDRVMQIKGSFYRLKDLFQNDALASRFDGGSCVLLRLAPVDYHRFHFIESGTVEFLKTLPGWYYSVNPAALKQVREVFCKNARALTLLHTEHSGDVLYVEVGATSVGSIVQTYSAPQVQRGDEKGLFKFGGSTILLFFEPGRAVFDEDLQRMTEKGIETKILAGEPIGNWI